MLIALTDNISESAEPIAQKVMLTLRRAIVTMRIRPGEMLSEQDIAKKLGVSRQPVREAFIKLGEAGLLRVLPQRGTLVVKISRAAVEDARFIREALECAVAREAARLMTPAQGTALSSNLARQRKVSRSQDTEAFFALDEEFHRLLAEAANRPSAWDVVEDVKPQMDRVRFLSLPDATPLNVLVNQHAAILAAVKAGSGPRAVTAMRAHLHEILRSLPQLAKQHPELFEDEASGISASRR
jgi:GntR family transcriptional regulator, rspAB operon transcriptional repressor